MTHDTDGTPRHRAPQPDQRPHNGETTGDEARFFHPTTPDTDDDSTGPLDDQAADGGEAQSAPGGGRLLAGAPRPINWHLLTAGEAEEAWLALNAWVNWLRTTYGLPPGTIPPLWHRHPELHLELSALHLHWLACHDPAQSGSAQFVWHRDFADARLRLQDLVAACGTRLSSDRPTRRYAWPGEPAPAPVVDTVIRDRDEDFVAFVIADIARRRAAEAAFTDHTADTPPHTAAVYTAAVPRRGA